MIRTLTESDRPALDAFLAARAASSMFLRSNLARAGVVDGSAPYQGRYVGHFDGATLTDVAAHYWNGAIVLQAPDCAAALAAAAKASGRKISYLLGPWDQTLTALDGLNLRDKASLLRPEDLFELSLDRIRAPDALAIGAVKCRRATTADFDVLIPWRIQYHIETLGTAPEAATLDVARADLEPAVAVGDFWVAIHDDEIVACSGFNARLPDMVQIGGVFTPKHLRGEGFARAAVAGSLFDARAEGVSRAILFTETRNAPAQRVYVALGFQRIGDYGMIPIRD